MMGRHLIVVTAALAASACVQPGNELGFDTQRTVFYNPLDPFPLGEGPVDPSQCGDYAGQSGCWFDGIFYPGVGRYAFARDGTRVELSRAERRTLRERTRLIREQIKLNRLVADFNARNSRPGNPEPSAPPIASQGRSQSPPATRSGANTRSSSAPTAPPTATTAEPR